MAGLEFVPRVARMARGSPRVVTWLVVGGVLISGGFAVEGALAAREAKEGRDAAVEEVREAVRLAARHPGAFGGETPAAGAEALKQLVQGSASLHSLYAAFLSENEKEAGKGQRERQVTARLKDADHKRVVAFLDDLEKRGGGARVRELRLRPSPDASDVYQEVEVVLAKRAAVPGGKP